MRNRSGRRPVLDLLAEPSNKTLSELSRQIIMNRPSNATSGALAGLLGDYGSDTDDEVSSAPAVSSNANNHFQEPIWSICVDPSSGFPYYWEQITNTVSWEPPPGLVLPPAAVDPFAAPSAAPTVSTVVNKPTKRDAVPKQKTAPPKKPPPPSDDSSSEEEERIELITSYYNPDSGSEEEESKQNFVVRVYPANSKAKVRRSKPDVKGSEKQKATVTKKSFGPDLPKTFGPNLPQSFMQDVPKTFGPDLPQGLMQDIPKTFGPDLPQGLLQDVPKTSEPDLTQGLIEDVPKTFGPDLPSNHSIVIASTFPEQLIQPTEENPMSSICFDESEISTKESVEPTQANSEEADLSIQTEDDSIKTVIQSETNGVQDSKQELDDEGENKFGNCGTVEESIQPEILEENFTQPLDDSKNNEDITEKKSLNDLETDNLEDLIEVKSKLLKKLGELVPSEIMYLVGSPKSASDGQSEVSVKSPCTPLGSPPPPKNHTALDMDVDDLIAQIEKEQPIDQPHISSDASETMESISNKSSLTTEDTSQPKSDNMPFKPLFPSAQLVEESQIPAVKDDSTKIYEIQNKETNQTEEESGTQDQDTGIKMLSTEAVAENKVFNKYEVDHSERGIESSAFKRKRRIALDVLPAKKQAVQEDTAGTSNYPPKRDLSYTTKYAQSFETCGDRIGLGFQPDLNEQDFENSSNKKKSYSNFKKGNIMFHKGEELTPVPNEVEIEREVNSQMEDKKALIEAKLNFLTQSLPPVPPLQQLYIELQTLWAVAKSSGLQAYISGWLDTAGAELSRLEQNAAPPQWTCRFCSESGCYVYENEVTGQQQWSYPVPGAGAGVEGLEDMDICTTPPPPPPDEPPPLPPLPPPPPPPLTLPPKTKKLEPLPPGTISPPDPEEIICAPPPPSINAYDIQMASQKQINPYPYPNLAVPVAGARDDALCAALDSFYSDIADLDTNTPAQEAIPAAPPAPQISVPDSNLPSSPATVVKSHNQVNVPPDADKNKKKKKTKISSSIGLKNKSVSSLVEKWKKVQESLDD